MTSRIHAPVSSSTCHPGGGIWELPLILILPYASIHHSYSVIGSVGVSLLSFLVKGVSMPFRVTLRVSFRVTLLFPLFLPPALLVLGILIFCFHLHFYLKLYHHAFPSVASDSPGVYPFCGSPSPETSFEPSEQTPTGKARTTVPAG